MMIERGLAGTRNIKEADFPFEEPGYGGFVGGIKCRAGCSPAPHHFKA